MMMRTILPICSALLAGFAPAGCGADQANTDSESSQAAAESQQGDLPTATPLRTGFWLAELQSPGGSLPFGLSVTQGDEAYAAEIVNGPERIAVPEVSHGEGSILFSFPHYDSQITATLSEEGDQLSGTWRKRRGPNEWTEMDFSARWLVDGGADPRKPLMDDLAQNIVGKWSVQFSESSDPAVGVFSRDNESSALWGTFQTTTGDYRYLAGSRLGEENSASGTDAGGNDASAQLCFSCFDGAHAFLFHVAFHSQNAIRGEFWSSDTWHESWTASRDDSAALPDGFQQTIWTDAVELADLTFPDLEGTSRSLADEAFFGKARIIEVFGSWCPNCHDAAAYLSELDEKYRDRGLSILGLAFEHTGEIDRDAAQVQRYMEHHNVTYPVLIAGLSDKGQASDSFPALDRIRSYPTMIFLHGDGRVRAIYSGFSGPATGDAHQQLREEFEAIIEELLAEAN